MKRSERRASVLARKKASFSGTLATWVSFVTGSNEVVVDLDKVVTNGFKLSSIIEAVSGQPIDGIVEEVGKELKNIRNANLARCFSFLEEQGVDLEDVTVNDIVSGNSKPIITLLWSIFRHFYARLSKSEQSLLASSSPKDREIVDSLLEWVKLILNTYPGVDVRDWITGFHDGMALSAFVHFFAPSYLDFYALNPHEVRVNLEKSFHILENVFQIPKFFSSVDDLINGKVDEKTMIIFIVTVKNCLQNPPVVVPQNSASKSKREGRELIDSVAEAAQRGDKRLTMERLALVVETVKVCSLRASEVAGSAIPAQRAQVNVVRSQMDSALQLLLADAPALAKEPSSDLLLKLAVRDCALLAGAQSRLLDLIADETGVSERIVRDLLAKLSQETDGEHIRTSSKLLNEELTRLIGAVSVKAVVADNKQASLVVAEGLEEIVPRVSQVGAHLADAPNDEEARAELSALKRDIWELIADVKALLAVGSTALRQLKSLIESDFFEPTPKLSKDPARLEAFINRINDACLQAAQSARDECSSSSDLRIRRAVAGSADVLHESLAGLSSVTKKAKLRSACNAVLAAAEALLDAVDTMQKGLAFSLTTAKGSLADLVVAVRQGNTHDIEKSVANLCGCAQRSLLKLASLNSESTPRRRVSRLSVHARDLEALLPQLRSLSANTGEKRLLPKLRSRPQTKICDLGRDIVDLIQLLEEELVDEQPASIKFAKPDTVFNLVTEVRKVADTARAEAVQRQDSELLLAAKELEDVVATSHEKELGSISDLLKDLELPLEKINRNRSFSVDASSLESERSEESEKALKSSRRVGRLVRAGDIAEATIAQIQLEEVLQVFAKTKREQAKTAPPDVREKVERAIDELETVFPIQAARFQQAVAEQDEGGAQEEYAQLSDEVSGLIEEVNGLFPDLLISTETDLNTLRVNLEEFREDDLLANLRRQATDLKALDLTGSPLNMNLIEPEMLQLDAVDTPDISRKKKGDGRDRSSPPKSHNKKVGKRKKHSTKGKHKRQRREEAEQRAQAVIDALADQEAEDKELTPEEVDTLSGVTLPKLLQTLYPMLKAIRESGREMEISDRFLSSVIDIVSHTKMFAANLDDEGDTSTRELLYECIDNFANRCAEFFFDYAALFGSRKPHADDVTSFATSATEIEVTAKKIGELVASFTLLQMISGFNFGSLRPTGKKGGFSEEDGSATESVDSSSRISNSAVDHLEQVYRAGGGGGAAEQSDAELLSIATKLAEGEMGKVVALAQSVFEEGSDDTLVQPLLESMEDVLRKTMLVSENIADHALSTLLSQSAEAFLGRFRFLAALPTTTEEEVVDEAVEALDDAGEHISTLCNRLTAKSFAPERSVDSDLEAQSIARASEVQPPETYREGQVLRCLKSTQTIFSPLSAELRVFRANAQAFDLEKFTKLTCELLTATGSIGAGLKDEPTRLLVEEMRQNLTEPAIAFVLAAKDVLEFSTQEKTLANNELRKVTLALIKFDKWTKRAKSQVMPARLAKEDEDAVRIKRQIGHLRNSSINTSKVPLSGVQATNLLSASRIVQRELGTVPVDCSAFADSIVHMLLVVQSLVRGHSKKPDVKQIQAMSESVSHLAIKVVLTSREVLEKGIPPRNAEMVAKECSVPLSRLLERVEQLAQDLNHLSEMESLENELNERIAALESGHSKPSARVLARTTHAARTLSSTSSSSQKTRELVSLCLDAADASLAGTSARTSAVELVRGTIGFMKGHREEDVTRLAQELAAQLEAVAREPMSDRQIPPLELGKAATVALGQLKNRATAMFAADEELPKSISDSVSQIEPVANELIAMLPHGPTVNMRKRLLYFLNLLKHLATAYATEDDTLIALVGRARDVVRNLIILVRCIAMGGPDEEHMLENCRVAFHALVEHVSSQLVLSCSSCHLVIAGSFFTKPPRYNWHEKCMVCFVCQKFLGSSYYFRDEKILCSEHVVDSSLCCARCNQSVGLGTSYLECGNGVTFHGECFNCNTCNVALSSDRFFLTDNEVYCENHA